MKLLKISTKYFYLGTIKELTAQNLLPKVRDSDQGEVWMSSGV